MNHSPIINNAELHRFESLVAGEYAYVEYRLSSDRITLLHTFVPEAGRGTRLAAELAQFALEFVKKENLKLTVICPFINKYISKHPEYATLTDNNVQPS